MTGIYIAPFGTPAPIRLEYDRLVRQIRAARAPWHLTFDTPSTSTRQDPIVTNFDAEHDYDDASNCPRCETGRFAPGAAQPEAPLVVTPRPAAPGTAKTKTVQYGKRHRDGAVIWPDVDEELYFDSTNYTDANELEPLLAAAKADGIEIVSREITTTTTVEYGVTEVVTQPEAPLPTTLGSVARSSHAGEAETFVLTSVGWTRAERGGRVPTTPTTRLAASPTLEILFDAGAAA